MSQIAIKGNTTGSGTFTIESPATNTDRTLTLPDEAGTVLTSASTIDSSKVLPSGETTWPAFRVAKTSNQNITTTAPDKVLFDTTIGNDGTFTQVFTYSAGNISIPVTGIYQVNVNLRLDDLDGAYCYVYLVINGDTNGHDKIFSIEGSPSTAYQSFMASGTLSLSSGDYISAYVDSNTDSSFVVHQHSEMSGHLVAAV